jgi:hypothetical protein
VWELHSLHSDLEGDWLEAHLGCSNLKVSQPASHSMDVLEDFAVVVRLVYGLAFGAVEDRQQCVFARNPAVLPLLV